MNEVIERIKSWWNELGPTGQKTFLAGFAAGFLLGAIIF